MNILDCKVGIQRMNSCYGAEIIIGTKRKNIKQGTYLRITKEGLVYPTRQLYLKPKRGRPKKKKKVITFIGVFLEYA